MNEIDRLRETIRCLTPLADVGEMAGPVAHEFSDVLNVLLLQVQLMEYELPGEQQANLTEIRRQITTCVELLGRFHEYRRALPSDCPPSDLNEAVRSFAPPEGTGVGWRLELANEPLLVPARPPDLERLVRFLTDNAVRAVEPIGGAVTVTTQRGAPGWVVLRVEDTAPVVADRPALAILDPRWPGRPGTQPLELAACRSLVRRLDGTLAVEPRPGQGLAVVAQLPAAS